MLAAQRAFKRERLALAPKDEDLRSRLTKIRGGDANVPSTSSRKSHLSASALQREYVRSQERARRYREGKAKAEVADFSSPSALANYVPSDERRIAEVVQAENRRLRFENDAFRALVLSLGVAFPEGVRGRM